MLIKVLGTKVLEDDPRFKKLEVSFLQNGKTPAKRVLPSFSTPSEVWDALQNAAPGESFSVKAEKKGKYWNWTSVSPVGKEQEVTQQLPQSRFESPEERAKRQVFIIRQSSLATAVDYMAAFNKGSSWTPEDVIETARKFEAYVLE